jgi:hypothetical protein
MVFLLGEIVAEIVDKWLLLVTHACILNEKDAAVD